MVMLGGNSRGVQYCSDMTSIGIPEGYCCASTSSSFESFLSPIPSEAGRDLQHFIHQPLFIHQQQQASRKRVPRATRTHNPQKGRAALSSSSRSTSEKERSSGFCHSSGCELLRKVI